MLGRSARVIGLMSLVCCFLWAFSLGWAFYHHTNHSETQKPQISSREKPQSEKQGFTVVALGDSLTRGTGDVTGKGYVGYMMDHLKEQSPQTPLLYNLGIRGQTSVQLSQQVKQKQVQRQLQQADLIVMSIGGNDLFRGGRVFRELEAAKLKAVNQAYLKNLEAILSAIRKVNPQAKVLLIGLYNPFSQQEDGAVTSKVVRDWNNQTAEVCAKYPPTLLVPTYDLFQLQVEDYLYSDKFHPNSEGYRLMGERLASLVK